MERKVVTVVFADLIGSTALHERLDPESVSRIMEGYHRSVRAPVETHGRIFAIDSTLHNLGDLISLPLVGLVAAGAGVQVAGSTMAAAPILGGAAMWWWSRRQRPANEAEPDACPEPAAA